MTLSYNTSSLSGIAMRVFLAVFFVLSASIANAQDKAWPRTFDIDGYEFTAYAPELHSISGTTVKGRSAFSVTLSDTNMVFGAMSFVAEFKPSPSDKSTLNLASFSIERLRLPEEYERYTDTTARAIERSFMSLEISTTKERLQNAVKESTSNGIATTDIKNDAPKVIISEEPSLLVFIDGDPSTKAIENSIYEYVINSKIPILYDPGMGYYYLPNGPDWYSAQKIKGEWSPATSVPSDLQKLVELDTDEQVDVQHDVKIIVSTKPAELVVFDGKPAWQPLVDTDLLTATNSESSVFKSVADGKTYLLISGRWFASSSLKGPWTFVEPDDLPSVFAKISPDSEQGSALAAVAGTPQAEDAVLEAYIPKTATVDRKTTTLTVTYDGEPWFEKVSGSPGIEYAVNTTTPVLKISGVYYAVDNGVWFKSSSATGPWAVSDVRPDEVNSIPNSSPVANVKYVYVYNSTPSVVYVGYTPGYYGTFVYGPTVVYGTGWYYNPWYGPHFYPRPYTYGFHVHYSPYRGWGFGYSAGWAHVSVRFGPTWYRAPYYRRPPMYRPPAYRPGYRPGYRPPAYRPPAHRPPANRPTSRPSTRPTTRPSTSPATRPSTRPSTGYRPSVRPNVPSGSVGHPTSRPSSRPAYSPSSRPSSRPQSRPSGGQMRRSGGGGRRR